MAKIIDEKMLDELRDNIAKGMSERRFNHVIEVEKMAILLARLYCPEKTMVLRAAALLHGMTKEYDDKVHISILSKPGIEFTVEERLAPKTFHARTASLLIPDLYPEFVCDDVIAAVRWHTTGRAKMSLVEKVLYLADYIDMSREYEDCVKLRDYFFSKNPEEMDEQERLEHLDRTLIRSFDMNIEELLSGGRVISRDTISARNDLISGLNK